MKEGRSNRVVDFIADEHSVTTMDFALILRKDLAASNVLVCKGLGCADRILNFMEKRLQLATQ